MNNKEVPQTTEENIVSKGGETLAHAGLTAEDFSMKPIMEAPVEFKTEDNFKKRLRVLESMILLNTSPWTKQELFDKTGTYNEYRKTVLQYNDLFEKEKGVYEPQINTTEEADALLKKWTDDGRGEILGLKYENQIEKAAVPQKKEEEPEEYKMAA